MKKGICVCFMCAIIALFGCKLNKISDVNATAKDDSTIKKEVVKTDLSVKAPKVEKKAKKKSAVKVQ
jgi:hypothetical protein